MDKLRHLRPSLNECYSNIEHSASGMLPYEE
nr:MAG TPA: hypothetical protein [Bacteriophage sp.]